MEYIFELEELNKIIYFIRIFIINLSIYYMDNKIIGEKNKKTIKDMWDITIIALYALFLNLFNDKKIEIYEVIFSLVIVTILLCRKSNKKFLSNMIITVISMGISYIMYIFSLIISFIVFIIFNIKNEYINMAIIILIYGIIYMIFIKINKIKYGLKYLQEKLENTYLVLLSINISTIVIFVFIMLSNYNKQFSRKVGILFLIVTALMYIAIKESLDAYYKHNMLVKELEDTKKKLVEKENENKELENEILGFNKRSHTIAHKQKALEYKIEQLMLNNEISEEITGDLKDISNVINVKNNTKLDKTGIDKIDNMIACMKNEADKKNIDFKLQIYGNIYSMINNKINVEDLETLIADHVKDAIIAIENSNNKNKSILLRLGKIDGSYGMYVYDSGIEFKIDTYLKLGKIPITTHKENGGTGMGFINTFDTLEKYNATLIIKELGKESIDNYTKVIMIKFNGKKDFIINSYRDKEIRLIDKSKMLNIGEI